jgi:4-amino-4-deoxy-L-arabinose transferase-like glycosyltransferase
MNFISNSSRRPALILGLFGLLLAAVYILGVIVPLFDHDSGFNALIGLRMYLTGDYVNLIDHGEDYLDKPHLLFWLSALGDALLGVGTLAYKLPSLILAIPGVYATYRLGQLLYSPPVGRNAALILVTSFAFILAQNDVRMDALLLSFTITATWLLYEFSLTSRIRWLVGGSLALALAFATKGLSGVFVPAVAVGAQVLYSRNWGFLRSFRWLWVIVLFFVFSSPVLSSYYLQFDLHPEKIIRGTSGHSGLAFILFYQNVERMEGSSWGTAGKSDPFFFFHTLLWALLPWGLLAYWAVFKKGLTLVREGFVYTRGREIMTLATIVVMFVLLSVSNFKLPHYLNILFPFFAILIAAQLQKATRPTGQRWLLGIQKLVAVAMLAAALVINLYLFPIQNWGVGALALVALFLLVREWVASSPWLEKVLGISAASAIFTNLLMNGNFYAQILGYQSGLPLAMKVQELNIAPQDIRYYHWDSNSFNYYSAFFYDTIHTNQLKTSNTLWLVGPKKDITQALDSVGVRTGKSYVFPHFRISRLNFRFLNPATRLAACEPILLVQINPTALPPRLQPE